jgi:hypothetical protein
VTQTPSWQIRPFMAGDEDQIKALFQRTFGKERSIDEWKWKFIANPLVGKVPHMFVAYLPASGRIVGHYAGIPCRMKVGERTLDAMVSVDTMTDPDYRRQGMLTRFGEVVYQAWAAAGQKLIIGLPNQQWGSRKEALGWEQIFPLVWLRYPVHAEALADRAGRLPGALSPLARPLLGAGSRLLYGRTRRRARTLAGGRDISVRPYDGTSGDFERIWQYASPSWRTLVVRDDAWVRWRYAEAVPVAYDILTAWSIEQPVGYIAFRVLGPPERRTGYIADIFTARDDSAALASLISGALESFRKRGAALGMALALPGTSLHTTLRKLGFQGTPPGMSFSFEAVSLDPALELKAQGSVGDWHIAGGDSDVI